MTDFRTEIKIEEFKHKLNYNTPALFLGSCFTKNIGNRFASFKFPLVINPFGVLYNPISILQSIKRLGNGGEYNEKELFEHNGMYHSFDHYSKFSANDISETLGNINQSFNKAKAFIPTAKFVFITLGTAYVFKHLQSGKVVSNCHKLPAQQFERYRLTLEQTITALQQCIDAIKQWNTEAEVIITVSPIRHLKDGAALNNVSKSTLILATHNMVAQNSNVQYFPAYELLLDDLRDYRFYEKDMLHPNSQAIDYIWNKLLNALVDENVKTIMQKVQKVVLASNHKPINIRSNVHQQFVAMQLDVIEKLHEQYPNLNLQEEAEFFKEQLILG